MWNTLLRDSNIGVDYFWQKQNCPEKYFFPGSSAFGTPTPIKRELLILIVTFVGRQIWP